jgi:transitional endoplasmic reticulum ATPase
MIAALRLRATGAMLYARIRAPMKRATRNVSAATMNQFNTPAYSVVRWGFVALFVVGILTSLRVGHQLGVQWPTLVTVSLIAAAAVWVQDRHNWMWTKAAFFVLSIGLLRLVLEFNETSWYGLAIWAVAALLWRHWHGLTGRATLLAPGARSPSAAQPSRQSPTEPPAPVYTFDQNVRTARYRFGDLVGMANTKKRLHAAGQAILAGDGATRNGILLFGEPGNGKTMFAEALAGELDVPFFTLTYGDVASKWINETPQKVDAAFKQAHRLGRCVLFIDEFDSFVKPRDAGLHAMDRDRQSRGALQRVCTQPSASRPCRVLQEPRLPTAVSRTGGQSRSP